MVTRCRGPTKEGFGVDRPSHCRRAPKFAIAEFYPNNIGFYEPWDGLYDT
jgi:hypothetical protein